MKNGWETVTFSEVCEISSSLVDPRHTQFQDFPHIGGANMESDTGELRDIRTAAEEGLKSGKFVFDDSTVLYSKIRPYLKKVARPSFKGLCSADVYPLSPVENRLSKDYLFHILLSPEFTDYAIEGSARAGMPKVNRSHLFAYKFKLPPLPEQRRIVGILDEAFASIAAAKAHSEQNRQNARSLFESCLENQFANTNSKTLTSINNEAEMMFGFAFKSNEYSKSNTGIKLLRGDNIVQRTLRWNDVALWPKEKAEQFNRFELLENDVVLAMDRPWVSSGLKYALISRADLPCLQVQRTARLRALSKILPGFLYNLLGTQSFITHILGKQTGIGVPHISGKQIGSFEFRLPSLPDQRRIVAQLDALRAETQALDALYARKLAALDELKQSLLHQAFSAQL
jgi:type I restriction enzyme S subunit